MSEEQKVTLGEQHRLTTRWKADGHNVMTDSAEEEEFHIATTTSHRVADHLVELHNRTFGDGQDAPHQQGPIPAKHVGRLHPVRVPGGWWKCRPDSAHIHVTKGHAAACKLEPGTYEVQDPERFNDLHLNPAVPLQGVTNARVWAREFVTMRAAGMPDDEGTMQGWFANAIENGRDSAHPVHGSRPHQDVVWELEREGRLLAPELRVYEVQSPEGTYEVRVPDQPPFLSTTEPPDGHATTDPGQTNRILRGRSMTSEPMSTLEELRSGRYSAMVGTLSDAFAQGVIFGQGLAAEQRPAPEVNEAVMANLLTLAGWKVTAPDTPVRAAERERLLEDENPDALTGYWACFQGGHRHRTATAAQMCKEMIG